MQFQMQMILCGKKVEISRKVNTGGGTGRRSRGRRIQGGGKPLGKPSKMTWSYTQFPELGVFGDSGCDHKIAAHTHDKVLLPSREI